LNALGLTLGDVITRLDGIPVTNFAELDNHYDVTYVRYIKQGTIQVRNGTIYIPWGGVVPVPPGGGGNPP
jgi:hypothetical protein